MEDRNLRETIKRRSDRIRLRDEHLKISYLLAEHGYELSEAERFKLYLSNTLEPDIPLQTELPI